MNYTSIKLFLKKDDFKEGSDHSTYTYTPTHIGLIL